MGVVGAATRAHEMGAELRAMAAGDTEALHKKVDEFICELIDSGASDEVLFRTVATILLTYKVPVVPNQLEMFAELAARISGPYSSYSESLYSFPNHKRAAYQGDEQ